MNAKIIIHCVGCGVKVAEFTGPKEDDDETPLLQATGVSKIGFFVNCSDCGMYSYYDVTTMGQRDAGIGYGLEQHAMLDLVRKWEKGESLFDPATIAEPREREWNINIDAAGGIGIVSSTTQTPTKTEGEE